MSGLRTVCKSKPITISLQLKAKLIKVCMYSVLQNASESWTIQKIDKDPLLAFEMKCNCWILHIRWQHKITNAEVRRLLGVERNVLHADYHGKEAKTVGRFGTHLQDG
jgi:hypothetical protein